VEWRTNLTSAAARAVHAGGNGVEVVACMVWGWGGGGLFDIILEMGLQAIPSAITEVLGGTFGEMRRHLASCRLAAGVTCAAQEQNYAGGTLPKNKIMQAGAVNKGR
jgi:hypothetical protein